MSLRWRLLAAGAAALILALGLAAAGLAQLFATHVERRAVAELSVHLDQVMSGLERRDGALVLARPPADPRFAQPYGGLYWQVAAGEALLRSRSLWDHELALPDDALRDGEAHVHRIPGPEAAGLLSLERTVALPERLGGGPARAIVAMTAAEIDSATRAFVTDMAPYLALLLLVLVAAQWAQVSVGLAPLRHVGARVSALRRDRAARMGANWPREVQPLASELDGLLAERDADVASARARAGDLAHGLKTPLQALLGESGRLRAQGQDSAAAGIEEVAGAMRAHVERELARARTAARARAARADAAEVARRVVGVLKRTPDGDRLDWVCDMPDGLSLAIDEADLAEALGALAENAARHARTRVTLTARAGKQTAAQICVADDGPGLPPARLAAMTTRGARADEGGQGSGLGLTIAAEIARAVGGDLSLRNTTPGLSACLSLPLA